jgi:hypothetical protein
MEAEQSAALRASGTKHWSCPGCASFAPAAQLDFPAGRSARRYFVHKFDLK